MEVSKEVLERFWSKVDVRSDDECWPWTKAHSKKGYGRFKLNGKLVGSNRLALAINLGLEIEEIEDCCHICDNPPCVNPKHLFMGTRSDNMRDCAKKGRLSTQN